MPQPFIGNHQLKRMLQITLCALIYAAPVSAQTFNDVGSDYWAYDFIEILASNGITAGCGNGNYCPEQTVSRAQMAVFLERGMNGSNFVPPTATGNVFLDVSDGDFAANFIEQLYSDGITAGCGNNNYCPDATVTRAQMAVFLLRARNGADYLPPVATGVFDDVDLSYWAAGWIEALAAEGITSGCGNGVFCPDSSVTRAQMAVFLVRTFDLPPIQPPAYTGSGLILSVDTDDGVNITTLTEEISSRDVFLEKFDETISAEVSISGNNPGINLLSEDDTYSIVIDGSILPSGSVIPVTVTATNLDNQELEQFDIVVNVLEPALVASGTLTGEGGAVLTDGGEVGFQIDQGELINPLGVQIYRAVAPDGMIKIRVRFDRDVSGETALASLTSNLGWESTSSLQAEALKELGSNLNAVGFSDSYPVTHHFVSYPGYYADGFRLATRTNQLATWVGTCGSVAIGGSAFDEICVDYDSSTVIVNTIKPESCFLLSSEEYGQSIECNPNAPSDRARDLAPVLFIHGYKAGEEYGGGEDTWKEFPKLVSSMVGPNSEELVPFEFRWHTDASFKVVADDLADAVTRIYDRTDRPVRIVAHSFGGLLVRALLQGQTQSGDVFNAAYVHSVMTLGTPHSGIFPAQTVDQPSGQTFPDGQDAATFRLCKQISCWQAGESRRIEGVSPSLRAMAGAGEPGGLISSLAQSSLPDSVPVVVGIGLKREGGANDKYDDGDGLISFHGQRFTPGPSSGESPLMENCANSPETGLVTEIVLGPLENGLSAGSPQPFSTVPIVGGERVRGYSHSGIWITKTGPNRTFEYAEPYVECADVETCDHAAINVFKEFVAAAPNDIHPYCIPANDPDAAPPPTMMGYRATFVGEYPNKNVPITVPYEVVVGPGSEILGGEIQLAENYSNDILRSNTDFGPDYIIGTYIESGRSSSATFNGPVYYFEESAPRIVNAWLDVSSDFSASEARITFSDHAVWVNMSGVRLYAGERLVIRLDLQND